jgi:DNA-binding transcriptional regulator YiaG
MDDGIMAFMQFKQEQLKEKLSKRGYFAIEVIKFRTSKGWTQSGLAAILDVSFETVNRWENSKWLPAEEHLKKLRKLGFKYDPHKVKTK